MSAEARLEFEELQHHQRRANNTQRRAYWRDARVLVDGRLVCPLPEPYHGRENTYDYYGCRCQRCTDVKNEQRRHNRAKRQLRQAVGA